MFTVFFSTLLKHLFFNKELVHLSHRCTAESCTQIQPAHWWAEFSFQHGTSVQRPDPCRWSSENPWARGRTWHGQGGQSRNMQGFFSIYFLVWLQQSSDGYVTKGFKLYFFLWGSLFFSMNMRSFFHDHFPYWIKLPLRRLDLAYAHQGCICLIIQKIQYCKILLLFKITVFYFNIF